MDPRACLDASEEKCILPLLGIEPQFLGVPTCSLACTLLAPAQKDKWNCSVGPTTPRQLAIDMDADVTKVP